MAKDRELYVNTGAPIPRSTGEFIDTGTTFEPTDDEVRRLAYKLKKVNRSPLRPTRVVRQADLEGGDEGKDKPAAKAAQRGE